MSKFPRVEAKDGHTIESKPKASFGLAQGQVWKTERGFVAIDRLGKRLIEYRFLRSLGQKAVQPRLDTAEKVTAFLKTNAGRLVVA